MAEKGVVEGYSTRLRLRRTRRKRRPEKLVMRKSQRDEVEEENAQQKDWVPQTCPKKRGTHDGWCFRFHVSERVAEFHDARGVGSHDAIHT